ncbi:class I SAM-dependent methyltransferase [Bacillus paranthracis]
MQQADMKEAKILDVACGTGNVTLPLVQKGLRCNRCRSFGRNVSSRTAKTRRAGYFIPFYQQDMRELDVPGEFDCVTIFL